MNEKLTNAIFDCGKADALMLAIETTYIGSVLHDGDMRKRERAECAFYALWDSIHKVQADLDELAKEFASH